MVPRAGLESARPRWQGVLSSHYYGAIQNNPPKHGSNSLLSCVRSTLAIISTYECQKMPPVGVATTVGIVTATAQMNLKSYDSLLTLNNLADHRYRLAFIHGGCANDVVHHPGKRCSYR